MIISHNLNDVFEIADRIAILYLGRMVAQDSISVFDRQSVVDYMTTGGSTREVLAAASGDGSGAPGKGSGTR
jgi:ABC-type sugar transport system ATPase subunit